MAARADKRSESEGAEAAAQAVVEAATGDLLDAIAQRVVENPALADAIAHRVVALLREENEEVAPTGDRKPKPGTRAPDIATTAEMCAELRIERTYAYKHRKDLGARKLGDGPKARMRWDMRVAREFMAAQALADEAKVPKPKRARRPRRRNGAPASDQADGLLAVPDFSF